MMKQTMKHKSFFSVSAQAASVWLLAAVCGCTGSQGPVALLVERSVTVTELVVATDPPGARIYSEDLKCLGTAPVTVTWKVEKLVWSDGKVDFRRLPERARISVGDELSVELSAKIEKGREKVERIVLPFSGKNERLERKITLSGEQRVE